MSAQSSRAGANLYVLTTGALGPAADSGRYSADLFKIVPSKPPELVRTVVPSAQGCHNVAADYESGVMVLSRPIVPETDLEFVLMKAPATRISHPMNLDAASTSGWKPHGSSPKVAEALKKGVPGPYMTVVTQRAIVDRPGRGTWLVLRLGNLDRGSALVACSLSDPNLPPETIGAAELASRRVSGTFGFRGGLGSSDTFIAESSGAGWSQVSGLERNRLPWPKLADTSPDGIVWEVLARNSNATVVEVSQAPVFSARQPPVARAASFGRYRILRSGPGRWEKLELPGPDAHVRLIQNWLLAVVAEPRADRISPGSENRRKSAGWSAPGARVPTNGYFRNSQFYYPGVLFLMDTATGRSWTLRTGEGDSEPLLVNGSTVYYRVNDRILMAEIQGNAIGAPTELARTDELRDAHWAFLGPN
ncbi:MAG: hypothetical protein U0Q16_35720 [Bryobacteraceae bacterium]